MYSIVGRLVVGTAIGLGINFGVNKLIKITREKRDQIRDKADKAGSKPEPTS